MLLWDNGVKARMSDHDAGPAPGPDRRPTALPCPVAAGRREQVSMILPISSQEAQWWRYATTVEENKAGSLSQAAGCAEGALSRAALTLHRHLMRDTGPRQLFLFFLPQSRKRILFRAPLDTSRPPANAAIRRASVASEQRAGFLHGRRLG